MTELKVAKDQGDPISPEDEFVVGRLTRIFVNRPRTIAAAVFVFALTLTAAGVAVASSGFAYATAAYKIESSVIQQRQDAFSETITDAFIPDAEEEEEVDDNAKELERKYTIDQLVLVYDSYGGNMLSRENVLKMAAVERSFLGTFWATNCTLVYDENDENPKCASGTTVLNFLYRNDKKHKELCEAGYCQLGADNRALLCGASIDWGVPPCFSTVYDWRDGELADESDWPGLLKHRMCSSDFYRKYVLDKDATCTSDDISSAFTRSSYVIGWPLKGYRNRKDRPGNQFFARTFFAGGSYGGNAKAALASEINKVSATSTTARRYATQPSGDKTISVTYSFFTTLKIFDVLFTDVSLAYLSVIFVFGYIWTNVGSLLIAMAGIFEIMMSLPLAFFFWRVIMQQREVELLQFLSIYLILCIGADDIFVFMDSWKASLTKPPAISGSVETRFAWTYANSVSAMFTTTTTTVLCLLTSAFSSIPAVSAFGIFTALVVIFDYLLVITWFPAMVLIYHRYVEKQCPKCCAIAAPCRTKALEPGEVPEERRAVRFLRDKFAPNVHKYRYALLAVGIVATACMGGSIAATFELANSFPTGLPDEHPDSVVTAVQTDEFNVAEDWKHQVTVIYGYEADAPIVYESNNQIYPGFGEETVLQYDPGFELTTKLQEGIVADCEDARGNETLVEDREVYCLLKDLRDWAGGSFPYSTVKALRAALEDFFDSDEYDWLKSNYTDYASKTGFVPDGDEGIKAYFQSFNTTIPQEAKSGPLSLRPYYRAWESHADECASQCIHVLPSSFDPNRASWTSFDFLTELVTVTIQSVGYSLLCAFVVLLFTTRNWIVSLLVLFTIACIIVCVLASIFASGYELGVYECIYVVLTIGLSIDYAVHLSHFYVHATGTRYERAQKAITNIAISVIGGAITTCFAGLPLFGCVTSFLFLYGFFIFFTSFWAILFSFIILMPLLMIVGPEGRQGTFDACVNPIRRALGMDGNDAGAQQGPPPNAVADTSRSATDGGRHHRSQTS